jgi:hypothetical protein
MGRVGLLLVAVGVTIELGTPLLIETGQQVPAAATLAPPTQQDFPNKPQRIPGDRAQAPDHDQRGTDQFPLVVKVITPPTTEAEADKGAKDKPDKTYQWVQWVRIAAGKLSTSDWVAVGAVLVGTLQFWILWRTVRVMRRSSERQLRAYVSVEPGEMINLQVGAEIEIEMIITNHGQTPAHKTVHYGSVVIMRNPLPPDFRIGERDKAAASGGTIYPQGHIRAVSRRAAKLTSEEASALASTDQIRLYVPGAIEYKDVFGKTRTSQFLASIPSDDIQGLVARAPKGGKLRFVHDLKHTKAT